MHAGLALCWWQRQITFGVGRIRVNIEFPHEEYTGCALKVMSYNYIKNDINLYSIYRQWVELPKMFYKTLQIIKHFARVPPLVYKHVSVYF